MPSDSSVHDNDNNNDDATISDASSALQARGDAKVAALLAVAEQRDKAFPKQAHLMVHETSLTQPDVIEWIANGQAFMIHNPKSHKVADVIQKYFNHRKYSSLQRQLNIYGFSKKLDGKFKGAFHHARFHTSSTDADIAQIRRRVPPRKGTKKKKGGEPNDGAQAEVFRNNRDKSSSSDQLSIYGLQEYRHGGAFQSRASTADLAVIRRRPPLRRRNKEAGEQNDSEAAAFSRKATDASSSSDGDDCNIELSGEETVDEEETETEGEDESVGSSLGGRSTPTGVTSDFPRQVYALVSETAKINPSIIEWIEGGEAFVIHNPVRSKLLFHFDTLHFKLSHVVA